ncbi:hypothetical protein [Nakamurella leprariae]|nr:hypothetical protein [Nakamurella leprariae]
MTSLRKGPGDALFAGCAVAVHAWSDRSGNAAVALDPVIITVAP